VLNGRQHVADFLKPRAWLRLQTARLMATLGAIGISSEVADAARKGDRRDENQGRKNDQSENSQDHREEKNQNERGSDRENDRKASTEDQDSGGKSDKSAKNGQDESRSEDDGKNNHSGSKSGRDAQRQDADSKSNSSESSTEENDSHHHGGRHVRLFEQRAEDEPADDVADASSVAQENPNVSVDDVPATSVNDLVVEANDNVIASVSTSGGFAFARSGGVTAVTGPDGASIIQTGDVTTGTRGSTPAEPSEDGGNNDLDFSS